MHVAVVGRVLLYGQLQQRQIRRTGFFRVRVMVQLEALNGNLIFGPVRARPGKHLVYRVRPAVAVAGMDLIRPKYIAFRAVRVKIPGIAVQRARMAGPPRRLQRLPPARAQHLVQVGTHADVRVFRHQLQAEVARHVEPPGRDLPARHNRAALFKPFNRVVFRSGVHDDYLIGLGHGL